MKPNNPELKISALFIAGTVLVVTCALVSKLQKHSETVSDGPEIGTIEKAKPRLAPNVKAAQAASARTVFHYDVNQHIEEAPHWTVRYGQEFWRSAGREAVPSQDVNGQQEGKVNSGINLGEVIERVSHAISKSEDTGLPAIHSKTYSANFDGEGFRLSPSRLLNAAPAGSGITADSQGSNAGTSSVASEADPNIEVRFRTLQIQAGGQVLYSKGAANLDWSLLGNTVQNLLNPGIGLVEHYEARHSGIEVTWVLNERPENPGPLQIQAELTGLQYLGKTETGLHFGDETGTPRVKVTDVTLVDMLGNRTLVPSYLEGGKLQVEVSPKLLAAAAFPIAIDPTIGPEFGMGVKMATAAQVAPALAWNGTNYLAVWSDYRNASAPYYTSTTDIYGSRISPLGEILDTSGLAISTSSGYQENPRVASNGDQYFVIWADTRDGGLNIYGKRVTGSGTATGEVAICTLKDALYVDVASNGTNYLVVWQDYRNTPVNLGYLDYDIYAARVTGGGTVQDTNGFTVSSGSVDSDGNPAVASDPKVASNGADYFVVWDETRNVTNAISAYGARVTSGGSVTDVNGFLIMTNSVYPAVAWAKSGTNYLVAAETLSSSVHGNRVTTSATLLDGSGFTITTDHLSTSSPSAATDGTNYLVVWDKETNLGAGQDDIRGARVRATDGTVLDGSGIDICVIGGEQFGPVLASSGSAFLVAWTDGHGEYDDTANDIYASRITTGGTVLDRFPVSTAGGTYGQSTPAVASAANGMEFLVAWDDFRNGGHDIYAARVDSSNGILDPSGIVISTASGDQQRPAITSNGSDYFVVWDDHRNSTIDIYGARVIGGVLSETNGIAISTATNVQDYPSVANIGTNYFVVWQDTRNNSTNFDIYGARVSDSGALLDASGIAINTLSKNQLTPSVAANGTNFLVVWEDFHYSSSPDIYGTRINTSGTVLDGNGVAISNASNNQLNPGVASNGADFLVVWADTRNSGTTGTDIYGARVTGAGVLSDTNGIVICNASSSQVSAKVASTGTDYLVVWQDLRNGSTEDIYGSKVHASNGTVDSNFAISTDSGAQTHPVVANATTSYLVIFEDFFSTSGLRLRGASVTP